MTNSDRYTQILLEEIRAQNRALLEGQASLLGLPAKVDKIEDDVAELKSDVKVIKAVLRANNDDVKNHEKRITKLEKHTFGKAISAKAA